MVEPTQGESTSQCKEKYVKIVLVEHIFRVTASLMLNKLLEVSTLECDEGIAEDKLWDSAIFHCVCLEIFLISY